MEGMPDDTLLSWWANAVGMSPLTRNSSLIHGWGDMEVAFAVERDGEGFAVVREDRGRWTVIGRFSEIREADSFLLTCFVAIWRANRGLDDNLPADPPSGSEISSVDGGYQVDSRGHRAVLTTSTDAKRYSHVAGLDSQAIVDVLTA